METVARELATLFQNLGSSDQAATRPSQRLANAVLLSTHTLLHSSKQASERSTAPLQPPPLPARPSPAPPASSTQDIDMVGSGAASALESMDAASNSSSRTLVGQDDARSDHSYEKLETAAIEREFSSAEAADADADQLEDVKMADVGQAEPADDASALTSVGTQELSDMTAQTDGAASTDDSATETVDQKVLNALEHQKRSSGTDQQDVEEVMGSIINRLQAAIRPSSVDERTGIQLEKIMETFFVTTVNYTKKFDENIYQHEISFDRSITAFPAPDGPCSLYDALGRNFDQQILEESKLSRYTAIKTLPPVLHVLIQRSQSMGSKNGNAVVIPETLYLDRFMDAPHDSPVFRRRVEDWALADRIADLKAQLAKTADNPSYMDFLDTYANNERGGEQGVDADGGKVASSLAASNGAETWDFDGPVDDDFLLVTPTESSSASEPRPERGQKPTDVRGGHAAIRDMMDKELAQREKALEQHLESMKSVAYRLHAVICHRGQLMSGHYWVWICDFEDRVWRWYNDADVKENRDTAEVLNTLSTSGEPYFLCYVRDEDKQDYVDVPKRQSPTAAPEEGAIPPSGPDATADADGDVNIVDAGRPATTRAAEGNGTPPPEYRIE
ncbi:hypothetical protein CDD83_4488 [Cordyceps sp. RAO-2017]|nr:hypothetical protein CDD83_4488 [Cordyceps sp. RAO-2017]